MRHPSWLPLAALAIGAMPQSAFSAERAVTIPPSTLDRAIITLARQTGIDIASTEPQIDRVTVKGVTGRMSAHTALDRLLADTPFEAVRLDSRSFRIIRRRAAPPLRARSMLAAIPAPPSAEIIVTATKRGIPLLRLAGSATAIPFRDPGSGGELHRDSLGSLTAQLPLLQHTELGQGRNKMFIRGIADSSFNGPTQSTATVYFDDVQLGYSGPDPDLRLSDVSKVEILEGPQGTLYGSGAIGGIIRVIPNSVDLTRTQGAMNGGLSVTRGGTPGYDLNAMVNLAAPGHDMGIRAVAYGVQGGGYIDDGGSGRTHVNRTMTYGGRIAGHAETADGWAVEGGGLFQKISADDSQYSERRDPPLTRRSAFPQPFANDVTLLRLLISKSWDNGMQLVAAGGLVKRDGQEIFDATRLSPGRRPTVCQNNETGQLFTQEIRLFRTRTDALSWLFGIALLHNQAMQTRRLGPADAANDIVGVTNRTQSAALYSEVTEPLTRNFSLTAGGRLTTARTDGEPSAARGNSNFVRGVTTTRIDPTIGVSWLMLPDLALYSHFQTGFRTGGLAVSRGIGRVANFRPDSISVTEAGIRYLPTDPRRPSLTAALSYARWESIQADLVDRRGLPYTANIGDAHIVSVEANESWLRIPTKPATYSDTKPATAPI